MAVAVVAGSVGAAVECDCACVGAGWVAGRQSLAATSRQLCEDRRNQGHDDRRRDESHEAPPAARRHAPPRPYTRQIPIGARARRAADTHRQRHIIHRVGGWRSVGSVGDGADALGHPRRVGQAILPGGAIGGQARGKGIELWRKGVMRILFVMMMVMIMVMMVEGVWLVCHELPSNSGCVAPARFGGWRRSRSCAMARCSRERTVPDGMLSIVPISVASRPA